MPFRGLRGCPLKCELFKTVTVIKGYANKIRIEGRTPPGTQDVALLAVSLQG